MAWLIGWYRRKPKLVRGSTAGAQTDYQLKLTIYKGSGTDTDNTIYLGGYVNNDFSDLRLTSSDETTLLPYWIESYISGVSAIVWIKIDSIPADPFTKTVYIYYDNPITSPISSGTNTFDFFDNYDDNDITDWTVVGCGFTPTSGATGGKAYISETGSGGCRYLRKNFSATTGVWETLIRFSAINGGNNANFGGLVIIWDGAATGYYPTSGYIVFLTGQSGWNRLILVKYVGGVGTGLIDVAWAADTVEHKIKVTRDSSNKFEIFLDGISKGTATDSTYSSLPYMGLYGFGGGGGWAKTWYWDNTIVHKYASPEPIWDGTSPEQTYTANLTVSSVPTGAEIWINNIDQGVITTGWFILNPDTYIIMLTKPGYEDYIEIITLESNQDAIVQGNLILATGNLDISSTPSGAEIFLAPTGSPLVDQGIVTPNTISLSPLTYDYKLTHIDYYDATGSFTITSGLTTTLNIPLTPLSCPIVPKYSEDTVTLNATPKDGIGPYYVEFRKNGVIIDPSRLGGLDNPIYNALENILIIRDYTLDDLDISSALTGTIDFSVYMEDSCPTGYHTCTDTCTITIGCIAPVCNFVVT